MNKLDNPTVNNYFEKLYQVSVEFPRSVLAAGLLFILVNLVGLISVEKNTSVEAFIPKDHVSVQTRDQVREVFGLKDPVILAVVSEDQQGIYTESSLALIRSLHESVLEIDNIRDDRVYSLASESSISGNESGINVRSYLEPFPKTPQEIAAVRQRVKSMAPHLGSLVSKDGGAALIVAEVVDQDVADTTYQRLLELAEKANLEFSLGHSQTQIHVAGQAAVSGYLSRYIDEDGQKLRPLAMLIILLVLWVAFKRAKSLLAPILIIAGSTIGSMGMMGWLGVNYYAITSALPVVLIAISVADAIHVMTRYYELTKEKPETSQKIRILESMADMWRPIALTTCTTIAGFVGIAVTSIMPPITYFGWFAALGIFIAWVFSLTVLPAAMMLLDLKASPAFNHKDENKSDVYGTTLTSLSLIAAKKPLLTLSVFFLIACVFMMIASDVRVDRAQIENFKKDEPIYLADQALNKQVSGTAYLDVIVQADEDDGLLTARRIQKIAALQDYLASLPHVQHTSSIADYISLLHRSVNGDGQLPKLDDAVSQYLLLYEASGDPTDLADKIDGNYRAALVRGVMNSRFTSDEAQTVRLLDNYLQNQFNEPGMTASLSGRVNIDFHWMKRLGSSHFLGVILALALVFLCSAFLFRDFLAGFLSLVPSGFAIVTVYALMAIHNIHLEVATSMFAAISVGLGVDYAIHLIERLRKGLKRDQLSVIGSIVARFPGGARACFFNAAGLALGFIALTISQLPTLQRFGAMIAIAALSSYLAALFVIPAAYAMAEHIKRRDLRLKPEAAIIGSALIGILLFFVSADFAHAGSRADDIANAVQNRPEGSASTRFIDMTLTDRRGKVRKRRAIVYRSKNEGLSYTRISYISPKRIRDTAFLSHDDSTNASDQRWLYLPVTKRVRRIPGSDRGDNFLGTDFTYEDINGQLKFDHDDYQFAYVESAKLNGRQTHVIKAIPVTKEVARELGYGGLTAKIDELSWLPVEIEFVDPDQRPLKKVTVPSFNKIDGIWTPLKIEAINHQTQHQTIFEYSQVSYMGSLNSTIFEPNELHRGVGE